MLLLFCWARCPWILSYKGDSPVMSSDIGKFSKVCQRDWDAAVTSVTWQHLLYFLVSSKLPQSKVPISGAGLKFPVKIHLFSILQCTYVKAK